MDDPTRTRRRPYSTTRFRPSLMLKIEDEEFSWDVLDALGALGRNVLAGRAVLSSHPRHSSTEEHNVDTYYISLTVLNLGQIDRMPYFDGKKRYGREIRNDPAAMKQKLVLPHIVLNNPGHIITLCESFDFTEFCDLCVEYGTIGIQCFSDKPDAAPPLAVFLKTPFGMKACSGYPGLQLTIGTSLFLGTIYIMMLSS